MTDRLTQSIEPPPPPSTLSSYEGAAGHTQEVGRTHTHGRGRRGAAPMHLHVVPEVGLGGEALVALLAGEGLFLGVDAAVTDELGGNPEGFPTVRALVAFGLGVNAAVVLQRHQVGELLLTRIAEVGAGLVAVLVVEQGAGVAVSPPTLVTDMRFEDLAAASSHASFCRATWIESLLLHQGEVQT